MTIRLKLNALFCAAFLAGCATPQIRVSDSALTMEVKSKVAAIGGVAYARDGKSVIAGSADYIVRMWDLEGARQVRSFKGTSMLTDVAYSPDGTLVVGTSIPGMTGTVTTLWNAATGAVVREIPIGGKKTFAADGRYLCGAFVGGVTGMVSFGSENVKLVDLRTGAIAREFEGHGCALSPDGASVLVSSTEARGLLFTKYVPHLRLFDIPSGKELWHAEDQSLGDFSPDGKTFLVATSVKENMGADLHSSYILFDAATGTQIKEFGKTVVPSSMFDLDFFDEMIGDIAYSPDGRTFLSGTLGAKYSLWDVATGTKLRDLKVANETAGTMLNADPDGAFSPDGRTVVVSSLAAVRVFEVATGEEVATLIGFEDGEWLITTPAGYYNASDKGDEYLDVKLGGQAVKVSQLREKFFRPDLVKLALGGKSLSQYADLTKVKPAPDVKLLNVPGEINGDSLNLQVGITEKGGGVGDVRVFVNGAAVYQMSDRDLGVAATANTRTIPIKLVSGSNAIKVIVFNADGSMNSSPATATVVAKYTIERKPQLHALIVGIDQFENPKLQLKYSVADATAVAQMLQKKGAPIFDKVTVELLITPPSTTKTALRAAFERYRTMAPDDVFVFYVASHGTVEGDDLATREYFLIPSNVGLTSDAALRRDAISQSDLKQLIASIPATKKVLLLDTCYSGALGEALSTRGLEEDTAVKVLSRAVGSSVLAASTSQQQALEGQEGHGVFTWVLLQGLGGKADSRSNGYVSNLDLASYVGDEVPRIAEQVFKRKQYPNLHNAGQSFPIVSSRP